MSDYISTSNQNKVTSNIECPEKMDTCKDLHDFMLKEGIECPQKMETGKDLYDFMLKEGIEGIEHILSDKSPYDKSKQGFIFERVVDFNFVCKTIPLEEAYTFLKGKLHEKVHLPYKNISELFGKLSTGGDGGVDQIIKVGDIKYLFQSKYGDSLKKNLEDNIRKMQDTGKERFEECEQKYKLGYFVKDKESVSAQNIDTQKIYDEIEKNNLNFDYNDIIKFTKHMIDELNEFESCEEQIKYMNSCLGSNRKRLSIRLHQKIAYLKCIKNIANGEFKHLIAFKPRSGKTLTILMIVREILKTKKRVLIMTSVPDTIKQFIKELNDYDEFKDIKYKEQNEFMSCDKDFEGIVFCSVQYLKNDKSSDEKSKQDKLKLFNFDCMVFDESHHGISTKKTEINIVKYSKNIVGKETLTIFASGTSTKTRKFYNIKSLCVYEWDIHEEACMKNIHKPENLQIMTDKFGDDFTQVFNTDYIDKDYTNCPMQVVIQPSMEQRFIDEINKHNEENGTTYGFSYSDIFALDYKIVKKKKIYKEKFSLCNTEDGKELLKKALSLIYSNVPMDNTIEKSIEKTQNNYNSRISDVVNPLMTIMYLPVNNGNGTIDKLTKTLTKFLKDNDLWTKYNIEFSTSKDDSDESKSDYTDFLEKCIIRTKQNKKKGCILLLGRKGTLGITYNYCDVTISLDTGHNIDDNKQKWYRALTPADGKTIGINVDMNIQRSYYYILNMIREHAKYNLGKSHTQILKYLIDSGIFIVNPEMFNFGQMSEKKIMKKLELMTTEMISELIKKDNIILDSIECQDEFHDLIKDIIISNRKVKTADELDGQNQDCPKPKPKIDSDSEEESDDEELDEEEKEKEKELVEIITPNLTKDLCKKVFPLFGLIMRMDPTVDNYNDIKNNDKYYAIIKNIVKRRLKKDDKKNKIENNEIEKLIFFILNRMNVNSDIMADIISLYSVSKPKDIKDLVAKHFIPSEDERKNNAEVPTPPALCKEKCDLLSSEFWKSKPKIGELSCGKGNYVLEIFDQLYKHVDIENNQEKCKVIIEECIYFGDIDGTNVFITECLLGCHAQSYCGYENSIDVNYKFNSYIGDTLELDIKKVWKIEGFDAVIGNPPYQAVTDTGVVKGGGNNLYTKFIYYADKVLKDGGYILFINPPTYFSPGRSSNKNNMNLRKDIFNKYYFHHINLEECAKYFNVGSRFIYYLIQKKNTPNENVHVTCKYNKNTYKCVINQKELNSRDYLPYLLTNDSLEILGNIKEHKCDKLKFFNSTVFDTRRPHVINRKKKEINEDYVKRAKDNGFKYPIKATGSQIVYASKECVNQGKKKVLVSESGYLKPCFDNGILGVGGHCFACLVNDETEATYIIKLLNSKLYTFYIEVNKWSGFHNKNVLQDIPYIKLKNDFTDQDVYNHFNLTCEQIKFVEKNI